MSLCRKPFKTPVGAVVGCGRCVPCRVERKSTWVTRLLLERQYSGRPGLFVTLTYAPEHCPEELVKADAQAWMKRFRKELYPRKVRYFLVGEYGDQTLRPHYHALLFGVDLADAEKVGDTWAKGFVKVGELNEKTIAYTAGYLMKGQATVKGESVPPFALMSRNPGIGAGHARSWSAMLEKPSIRKHLQHSWDVPSEVVVGGKKRLVGRYLLGKMRLAQFGDSRQPEAMRRWQEFKEASWSSEELVERARRSRERAAKLEVQESQRIKGSL